MENILENLKAMFEAATGDVRRLDDVVRFSSIPVVVHELVSTHQYWVGLYAALIHSTIRPSDKHLLGRIMTMAATHDLIEGWTGDFVRTFKYSSEKLRSAISEAEANMMASLPSALQQLCADEEDDEHDYIMAVVKTADFMSLQQYMVREWMRGNKSVGPFYERMVSDLRHEQIKMSKNSWPFSVQLSALFGIMLESAILVRQT
jgi:5'-deoxynucleotidase YfbR-like HD superfamily hydrolase